MEWRHLRSFLTVAEFANVSRAADASFISQPALSRQIKRLERDLGVRLFERVGRRLRLTNAGEVLFVRARLLLEEAEHTSTLIREAADRTVGVLRVAASPVTLRYVVVPALPIVQRSFPKVEVHLREVDYAEALALLLRGETHIAFGPISQHSDEFYYEPIYTTRLYAVLSPSHRLASKEEIRADDLVTEQLLLVKAGRSAQIIYELAYQAVGFHPQPAFESHMVDTLLLLAEQGYGVALLTDLVPTTAYNVRALPLMHEGKQLEATLIVAWDRRRELPTAGHSLISVLRRYATKIPAANSDI